MIAAKMDAWMPAAGGEASRTAGAGDRWGFAMGWRGYRAFSDLDALSDAELQLRGLSRAELPQLALRAMRAGR